MSDLADAGSCIHAVPIFQGLPQDHLLELSRSMHHRRFGRGERVLTTGDPIQHLIVVSQGQLKLVRINVDGKEQVVRLLGPGQFVGEIALFTSVESQGDLIAVHETEACLLNRDAVQGLLQRSPDLALRWVKALAQRLAEAEQTIADMGLLDVGQRLAAELLRLSADGHKTVTGIEFEVPVPWAELAKKISTTPESLSRRLRTLNEAGLVDTEGRTVRVKDLEGLRNQLA